jgi:hypothetical protein
VYTSDHSSQDRGSGTTLGDILWAGNVSPCTVTSGAPTSSCWPIEATHD